MQLLDKMKGAGQSPPRVSTWEIALSWLGSFFGVSAVSLVHFYYFEGSDLVMIIGSHGASAVLIFGASKSPLAQPRNVLGGHVLAALIGAACYKLMPGIPALAAPVAVSTAIAVMHATKTLHPPAGATALIAVIGTDQIHSLGFLYALTPVGAGAAIMILVGLIFNNLPRTRRYPEFWL